MSELQPIDLTRVHLIFKTHLDVGFTDFAARVVENYFTHYIPRAIELAKRLRESERDSVRDSGGPDRFIWTTGSWLIYEYLERADAAGRRRMEQAIADGDIAWHALPFTTHSENMDADLFRTGLGLSKELDRRFGKSTIAAKMTDVPGHTRGIVPLLAEAGVQFLHIGVNGASTPPDVPPVFIWREPASGAEVLVMYHKGSYGDLMVVPGLSEAIAFAHTGDNLGPQSVEQLQETYREMRARLPGVEIGASTMDAFAARLAQVRTSLPIISQEIGDTWIHGAGTDPRKEAQYRELLRWRRERLASGAPAGPLEDFSRRLLPVPEHTWGLDVKTHLGDWENYRAADFQAVRQGANYKNMEASWQEQRGYIRSAVDALPPTLKSEAEERLARSEPRRPDTSGFTPLVDLHQVFPLEQFGAGFDPQTGSLTHLARQGQQWALGPLGKFWYETFSAADYARFHRQYNVNKRTTWMWAIPDFTKPGLEALALEHQTFLPHLTWAGLKHTDTRSVFLFQLEMPAPAWQEYGAPRRLALEISFDRRHPAVYFDLQWFEKPACRLPEAAWFSFLPQVSDPRRWQMDKLGRWVSPLEVIRDGNRHLHAVGQGLRCPDGPSLLSIDTLDSALVAPGAPSLLDFNNRQPNLRQGLHFNLHNNLWGTNFPMWYQDDARFRFVLRVEPGE